MTTYATSETKLLQLIHTYPSTRLEVWFWWDVETLPYLMHGNTFWAGTAGECEALRWALAAGYRLDRDRIEWAGH